MGKRQILFNVLSHSSKGIQRYKAQCTWMYTFYLSPLCQASFLRSIQSSDIQLSAMVCHFSPPSLFPPSCHPILSTSLRTPHLRATRPFVSSSYPSGSRSRLLTTLHGSETKVPRELILPLSMRWVSWMRKFNERENYEPIGKKNDEIVARHRKAKRE